jgi:phosphatidylinositol-4,5-bisphosphate 3-kinase
MDKTELSILHTILLEGYFKGARGKLDEFLAQLHLVSSLNDAALQVKGAKPSERREVLVHKLVGVHLASQQTIPISLKDKVSSIRTEKCKVMDSKKLPLWIVFEKQLTESNSDATNLPQPTLNPDLYVIFKCGDDLRQDALTLQMMRIMDRLWKEENLDLRMSLYGCVSTGKDEGFIEVVTQSQTVSSIQLAFGGSTAAFKEEPLENWIRSNNPSEDDYDRAVSNFTRSCAGYCVATYCLGIGDRHNDNIMCHISGKLFHIDFGHFLGNMKTKFGIKRERAPFVLTPDFVYVVSKKNPSNFQYFVSICVQAYLVLRRKANVFINLFILMLSTGIPELQTVHDLEYLRTAFCLGMTEEAAAEEFRNLIFSSIRMGWSTQLNWWYVSGYRL